MEYFEAAFIKAAFFNDVLTTHSTPQFYSKFSLFC